MTYKGKPLVRKGKFLYYGNMFEPYVVMLTVMSTHKVKDVELADKVSVQLMKTDPDIDPRDSIVKKSEKNGLYSAMDIASIWLERALKSE